MTLTLDPKIWCIQSLPQSPSAVKVWSNSVNKYQRYRAENVCRVLTNARMHRHMDARTLLKHNASDHYIGRGTKATDHYQTTDRTMQSN